MNRIGGRPTSSRARRLGRLATLLAGVLVVSMSAAVPAGAQPSTPVVTFAQLDLPTTGVALDSTGGLCVTTSPGVGLGIRPSLRAHVTAHPNQSLPVVWGVGDGNNIAAYLDLSGVNITAEVIGPDGNLYLADSNNDQILRVDAQGTVTLFANLPSSAYMTEMAFGPDGRLYVGMFSFALSPIRPSLRAPSAHLANHQMRSRDTLFQYYGATAIGVAVNGTVVIPTNLLGEGPAFVFDHSGMLDALNITGATIDKFFPVTPSVATLAGQITVTPNFFFVPLYMAQGASGDFYVADAYGAVFQLDSSGNVIDIFSPSQSQSFEPYSLAFGTNGTLYVADYVNGQVDTISGLESAQGGTLYYDYTCTSSGAPGMPLNLKVTRHAGTVTGSWLPQPGDWFLCTLLVGQNPTSTTVRTILPTCTFTGLDPGGNYGIRVQAQNDAGVSPVAQALAPPPTVIQITCHKGTKVLHVAGYSPRCPLGWRRT